MSTVWAVEWLNTTSSVATPPLCVVEAGLRVTASDNGQKVSITTSASFGGPGEPFIPYEDLTEADVLGWAWANGVDKAALEASAQQQLSDAINPPVIASPLPW
jgi:hypothetical protein